MSSSEFHVDKNNRGRVRKKRKANFWKTQRGGWTKLILSALALAVLVMVFSQMLFPRECLPPDCVPPF